MNYNFDIPNDNQGQGLAKLEALTQNFGRADLIPLWVADMDFPVAPPIQEAMTHRLQNGVFGYSFRPESYFEALIDWQARRGWNISPEQLSYCQGVVPAISAIIEEFSAPGDLVLIQPPVYPSFKKLILGRNRRPLQAPLIEENGYYFIDFKSFEKALEQKPSLFILCSPHNPVGRVWTRTELRAILELCHKYGVMVISDEIHSDLVLWGHQHSPSIPMAPDPRQIISLVSASKTFNLAGLMASAAIIPDPAVKNRFDTFWKKLSITQPGSLTLKAVEAAWRFGQDWLKELISYLEGNISYIHDFCQNHIPQIKPNLPEATYLVWLDCRSLGISDRELASFFVNEAHLALNPGVSFGPGGEGFMRLNAASPRVTIQKALENLRTAVDDFQSAKS